MSTRVFGAEEGVTGALAAGALSLDATATTSGGMRGEKKETLISGAAGIRHYGDMRERFPPQRMAEQDAEGRALVVDFGSFVLFNLYVPAVSSVSTRTVEYYGTVIFLSDATEVASKSG